MINDSAKWGSFLLQEKEKPYFKQLQDFVANERLTKIIYPLKDEVFTFMQLTPLNQVQVVILGQDPYHSPGFAHGLAFSVKDGVKIPKSLQNIYKELNTDLQINTPQTGNLTPWAKQGVLLLNSILTVEEEKPASHEKQGWEIFTDNLIRYLSDNCSNLVFVLWGKKAQAKGGLISPRHIILSSPHPSPFSAYDGFFGSKPFSNTNKFLIKWRRTPIDWAL